MEDATTDPVESLETMNVRFALHFLMFGPASPFLLNP